MKINQITKQFKRNYNRPITMPRWKAVIIYLFWAISLLGYVLALYISLWLLLVGIVFQCLAINLPVKLDTGSWRNTEAGKKYIDKYCK